MLKIINGDIINIKRGIICHQVNCQGRIGAGISGSIIKAYPCIEKAYYSIFNTDDPDVKDKVFGLYFPIRIDDNITICNIFSQYNYGNSKKTGIVYTDMDKLVKCLLDICQKNITDKPVYVPYGIGCGLAGGNWEDFMNRINNSGYDIIAVRKYY